MALLRTTHKGPKSRRWSSLALEDGATAIKQLAGAKLTPTLDRAPGVRSRTLDSYAVAAPKYEWMTRLGESRHTVAGSPCSFYGADWRANWRAQA